MPAGGGATSCSCTRDSHGLQTRGLAFSPLPPSPSPGLWLRSKLPTLPPLLEPRLSSSLLASRVRQRSSLESRISDSPKISALWDLLRPAFNSLRLATTRKASDSRAAAVMLSSSSSRLTRSPGPMVWVRNRDASSALRCLEERDEEDEEEVCFSGDELGDGSSSLVIVLVRNLSSSRARADCRKPPLSSSLATRL